MNAEQLKVLNFPKLGYSLYMEETPQWLLCITVVYRALGLTEPRWVESSLSEETGRWTGQKQRLTQSALGSLQDPLIQIARWFNILLWSFIFALWYEIVSGLCLNLLFTPGGGGGARLLSAVCCGQIAKHYRRRGAELLQGRQGSIHWRTGSSHDSGSPSSSP